MWLPQALSVLSVRIQIPFLSEQRAGQGFRRNTPLNRSQMHLPNELQDPLESLTPQQLLLKCSAWGFFHLTSAKYPCHLLSSKGIAGTQQMIICSMLHLLFMISTQTIWRMLQHKDWSRSQRSRCYTHTASFRLSSSIPLQYNTS